MHKDCPITDDALAITVTEGVDLDALGARWRALEARADGSFFQSWTWLGCLVHERFTRPVLLAAREGGRDVALALFNRGRSLFSPNTLWLGETGVPELDAVYVEHNGILFERGREDVLVACLKALLQPRWGRRVVMSGVDDVHLAAARKAGGVVRVHKTQLSPYVDFSTLPEGQDGFLRSLSANTRYQLRRSVRSYEEAGPLVVTRAETVVAALEMLDELERLHQATWTARGRTGAFANRAFRQFHHALVERGHLNHAIDLLRISAGKFLIGVLYNFRHFDTIISYQSGLDYSQENSHQKPGMTAHYLAAEEALSTQMRRYDFLAGNDRYKTSFANDACKQHWLDVVPRWTMRSAMSLMRNQIRRLLGDADAQMVPTPGIEPGTY